MLNVIGLNHFYYVRDFTDMRCKHSRVLSIIRERLHRESKHSDMESRLSEERKLRKSAARKARSLQGRA